MNDMWKYDPHTGLWTWVSGPDAGNVYGVYGTRGVPASTNLPEPRTDAVTWTDPAGNLWLFGGFILISQRSGMAAQHDGKRPVGIQSDYWIMDLGGRPQRTGWQRRLWHSRHRLIRSDSWSGGIRQLLDRLFGQPVAVWRVRVRRPTRLAGLSAFQRSVGVHARNRNVDEHEPACRANPETEGYVLGRRRREFLALRGRGELPLVERSVEICSESGRMDIGGRIESARRSGLLRVPGDTVDEQSAEIARRCGGMAGSCRKPVALRRKHIWVARRLCWAQRPLGIRPECADMDLVERNRFDEWNRIVRTARGFGANEPPERARVCCWLGGLGRQSLVVRRRPERPGGVLRSAE